MKIIYLLPPSEWKNPWGTYSQEKLSFDFEKPVDIGTHATQKDLKCSGKRYEEGIELNKKLVFSSPSVSLDEGKVNDSEQGEYCSAISRYSWVMYNAIDYAWMSNTWKEYFDESFFILSGMYWMVKPQDTIGNYKLPVETKWLREFWWEKITEALNTLDGDIIVDLLPNSYKKIIDWKKLKKVIVRVDFFEAPPQSPSMRGKWTQVGKGNLKKFTHWVKKVKWEFIHKLCKDRHTTLEDFPHDEKVQILENEYHISIIS